MQNNLLSCLSSIPETWETYAKNLSIDFSGIKLDSRKILAGDIFFAIKGDMVDGHRFIQKAVENGAVAVFGTEETNQWMELEVPYIRVENCRKVMAYLAAAFYDYPAKKMTIIGVTGTDGKTTTANMIYQILSYAGYKVGMVSTVNARIGNEELDTGFHVTTPESPQVQDYLQRMVSAGLTHVVLETTSHGLAQERVTACEFDIGVVTNVTHEHLDYHGDYDHYLQAKGRLFEFLSETRPKENGVQPLAVLNADDQSYAYLSSISTVTKAIYSICQKKSIWAEQIQFSTSGISFSACGENFSVPVYCKIAGIYNVSNALAALSVAIFGFGISPETAAMGISELHAIPGRMEMINLGQNFSAIVDFAHTPNALERALQTAKQMTSKRVIAVFGSAGLRDREKRRLMAEISAKTADITILTAEDPRTESLEGILEEMKKAAVNSGAVVGHNLFLVPDRREAIRLAITKANSEDLVLVCGKGHEQSMCFGEIEYSWDDRTAMRAALSELLVIDGPQMPYLPT